MIKRKKFFLFLNSAFNVFHDMFCVCFVENQYTS